MIHERLVQTLEICDMHCERLAWASGRLRSHFPLQAQNLPSLSMEEIAVLDQLVFRFGKLQDVMGVRLFPDVLEFLGEDYRNRPFLDVLARLEKLELMEDSTEWAHFREIRNEVAHEYPSLNEEKASALNRIFESSSRIIRIYENLKSYLNQKM